ncbi:biopolymer transporter ExbD [Acidovorax lacteus]|uniref:Biopolymer transporter ExbD n=1 Tax=Acidovorax lacteus TaxID=1924988 RepID=A0ABP8L2N6_9BURK
MNFRPRTQEEPEINLIPFIDVLLVILIFLVLTTTYSKFTEMQLTLPVADAAAQRDYPKEIVVTVAADGRYAVNKQPLEGRSVDLVAAALARSAAGQKDSVLIISADAMASHQSVITVMEAARRSGLAQITFATQSSATGRAEVR